MLVEAFVERGNVEIHVGVMLAEEFHAFGGGYESHKADTFAAHAAFLENVDGVNARVAGCEHRVDDDESAAFNVRKLHEVFDRLQVFIAVEADVTNTSRRHEHQQAVGHAEAGSKHGHDHAFLAFHYRGVARGNRGFDSCRSERKVARELINMAISLRSSRKSRVEVSLHRINVSLCWTSG